MARGVQGSFRKVSKYVLLIIIANTSSFICHQLLRIKKTNRDNIKKKEKNSFRIEQKNLGF
jgi:hypothetical protein